LKTRDAFEIVKNAGYKQTQRTMDRHIVSVMSTGHALSPVEKDGRHASLNDEQMLEVNTWVLGQNSKNSLIGYADVQKFINDKFNIKVCTRTAGKILHGLGHTQKTCMSKTAGFTKTNDQLKQEYMEFITKMKIENRFYRHPSEISLNRCYLH